MPKLLNLKAIFLSIAVFISVSAGNSAFSEEDGLFVLTAEESEWLDSHPAIRLAPAPNFPPLEFCNEEGQYLGVVSDYAALMEERLGIPFEIVSPFVVYLKTSC